VAVAGTGQESSGTRKRMAVEGISVLENRETLKECFGRSNWIGLELSTPFPPESGGGGGGENSNPIPSWLDPRPGTRVYGGSGAKMASEGRDTPMNAIFIPKRGATFLLSGPLTRRKTGVTTFGSILIRRGPRSNSRTHTQRPK